MAQALAQDILDSGRVSAFTAQGLTNVLWGFATLRYHPHAVLAAICEELHRRIHTLSAQVGPLGFATASARLLAEDAQAAAWLPCYAPALLCTRHEVTVLAELPCCSHKLTLDMNPVMLSMRSLQS